MYYFTLSMNLYYNYNNIMNFKKSPYKLFQKEVLSIILVLSRSAIPRGVPIIIG